MERGALTRPWLSAAMLVRYTSMPASSCRWAEDWPHHVLWGMLEVLSAVRKHHLHSIASHHW